MKFATITLTSMLCIGFAASANAHQPSAKPDGKKVHAVDNWAKRNGATEVWVNNPQAPQARKPATGQQSVDGKKVGAVNDWANRKGATEVWVNNPQAPRKQTQATNRQVSPAATSGAEQVTPTARMGKPSKTKHARKSKKKNVMPHSPPMQAPEATQ